MVQWLRICLLMQGTLVRSWPEDIPHAVGRLSSHTATTEAQVP